MSTFLARDLMKMSSEDIWQIPDNPKMKVKFDDGIIEADSRRIIFSHYAWWPMLEYDTPLLKSHYFEGRLKKSSVVDILNTTVFDTIDYLKDKAIDEGLNPGAYIDMEEFSIKVRNSITKAYNHLTYRLEKYVTGLSALDLLAVADHPRIKAINDELMALDLTDKGVMSNSEKYIAAGHEEIARILTEDGDTLRGTRQYELAASSQVDLRQQLQLSSSRGHVSDMDSNIFAPPILPGYSAGLKRLIDYAMDSRAAAKALIFTQHPLQETEYTNRELQILAATLCNLHVDDDCGSTNLTPWRLTKASIGIVEGMWYSEVDGSKDLKILKASKVQHLIGKTVYLRSALTCQHHDRTGICGKCFGELRWQIPRFTNIGHVSVTELCAKVSQDVLSVKHLDGAAVTSDIIIAREDRDFLKAYNDLQQIGLNPKLDVTNVKLRIPKQGLENLADVFTVSRVEKLTESKVSSMSDLVLELIDEDGDMDFRHVCVGDGNKRSYFTREFLKYVRKVSYGTDEDKWYIIDLSDWDLTKPIWQIPRRHASALEFLRSVKTDIKNTPGKTGNRGRKAGSIDTEALGEKLANLSDLVSNKFSINITHLATVIRLTMVKDSKGHDYHIPRGNEPIELETYRKLITNRSLGAASGYQELSKIFYSPHSYIYKNRPYSHFDELLYLDDK